MTSSLHRKTSRQTDTHILDDDLNKAIIRLLRKDGRMPYSDIASHLNVSEGTIRYRVGAMKRAGVLMITAIIEGVAAEYRTGAMLGIKVKSGLSPEDTAQRLNALDDVVYIAWVSGRYDLLVEIVSSTDANLLTLLTEHIHTHEDIASVEVMTGLKNFKNQFLLKRNWS